MNRAHANSSANQPLAAASEVPSSASTESGGPQQMPAEHSDTGAYAGEWTIRQWQQQVDQWIRTLGVRYFSELTNLAQLMEEVGELARLISRTYGEQSFKGVESDRKLADEMADVLFVLTCLANQTGVDLQQALTDNLAKKTARDATRHLQNSKLQQNQPE